MYLEPLYTERISSEQNGSTLPQLSRMLLSYREPGPCGVRVGYVPTLAEALDQVLGPGTGQPTTAPSGDAAAPLPPERAVEASKTPALNRPKKTTTNPI
ncbi:hypothetical protein [Rhodococcus sp. ZPP]|uniref:hypothetical protein n=1 Tax=Rhodococcus sp. ZPP TaxID=2749906 RepID=UPI001FCB1ECD|nr:hypothetical protein [Rhodococcus sp. ZPP]